MSNQERILCIGEILWDSLPSGLYLGGAPLNVCYHLNQYHIGALIASRVGEDRLGKEAIRHIESKGISSDLIQQDREHETGFVSVELSSKGDPQYDIIEPVAWDFIELDNQLNKVVQNCWGIVFGTLAQRDSESRNTIQKLWDSEAKKILDMNLRQPFIDRQIIHDSLTAADIVKMNEEEFNQLKDWYSISGGTQKAVEKLTAKFGNSVFCITRGANGAILFKDGDWFEHKGFPIKVKDAVGSGDAFLAALLYGIKNKKDPDNLLSLANATGAFVAQKDGATPAYSLEDILSEID